MTKKQSKATRLKEIKDRFAATMQVVAEMTGISINEVTRNMYVRISVDANIEGRLNKEELVEIGGFTKNKNLICNDDYVLPKVLIFDIETAPIEALVWSLWNNNVSLNQVKKHTSIMSYAAKFIGDSTIFYNDVSKKKDIRDDKHVVKELADLIDSADFVLTHNGVKFDMPKVRYRMLVHGVKPFSSVIEIDTLKIAKKYLGFDSNKLEHLTHMLCKKHKKLIKKKFSGQELWNECLDKNPEAWEEMKLYNIQDVLSLEELYVDHLSPYDSQVPNFSSFYDYPSFKCNCGNATFKPKGFHITKKSKFQKFQCTSCGKTHRSSENLHSKDKKQSLLV